MCLILEVWRYFKYDYTSILHHLHLFNQSCSENACKNLPVSNVMVSSSICHHDCLSCLIFRDVIMSLMASQITGVLVVYSTVCSGADQRKHQSSASLGSTRGILQWPVNSPHKGPVTRKMFPLDDVIVMFYLCWNVFVSWLCPIAMRWTELKYATSCYNLYRMLLWRVPTGQAFLTSISTAIIRHP